MTFPLSDVLHPTPATDGHRSLAHSEFANPQGPKLQRTRLSLDTDVSGSVRDVVGLTKLNTVEGGRDPVADGLDVKGLPFPGRSGGFPRQRIVVVGLTCVRPMTKERTDRRIRAAAERVEHLHLVTTVGPAPRKRLRAHHPNENAAVRIVGHETKLDLKFEVGVLPIRLEPPVRLFDDENAIDDREVVVFRVLDGPAVEGAGKEFCATQGAARPVVSLRSDATTNAPRSHCHQTEESINPSLPIPIGSIRQAMREADGQRSPVGDPSKAVATTSSLDSSQTRTCVSTSNITISGRRSTII